MPRKIDYETILGCKEGNSEAFSKVLAHYDRLINIAASKTIIDEMGNKKVIIDQEIKENIQQTLMLQIYLKYDHLEGPSEPSREDVYT